MKTDYTITANASIGSMNTFGIEARCLALITYTSPEALPEIAAILRKQYPTLPVMHIGAGSNLLPVNDFKGVILKSGIKGIEQLTGDTLRVGAAETFDDLITWALQHKLYGLENLSLIPGEVGASAVQNIGAYGAEAGDFIIKVEGYDLHTQSPFSIKKEDCRYSYRDSIFKHELRGRVAITHVTFRLNREFVPNLAYAALAHVMAGRDITPEAIRQEIIAMRRNKLPDPKVQGNAGSFFMNPIIPASHYNQLLATYPDMPHYPAGKDCVKVPAAWLIEHCGWKGKRLGNAAVHSRQALVLVNLGGATGKEVFHLMRQVTTDVELRFGITLKPEVNII